MRAIVTGATGFVGSELLTQLSDPVVLTRRLNVDSEALDGAEVHQWDHASPPPAAAFDGIEAVFHLAGEPIAEGRWTEEKKDRILKSRTESTRQLALAIAKSASKPRAFVAASAIGFYGSRGDEILTETSAPGADFLADVCVQWEAAAKPAADAGARVVLPRIGLVLGPGGGAMKKIIPLFKFGVGGRLGSGKQWMSWIHVHDLVRLMLHAVETESISGPMNAVAPEAVTNREFTRTLARVLHRPAVLPAPEFGLKMIVGEFAEVLLASQRVQPVVAEKSGFQYEFPTLESALKACVAQPAESAKD